MEIPLRRGLPVFTAPDHLYAARKVALIKRAFAEAGHPLSQDDCRRIVAQAWGYTSWARAKEAIDEGYVPGPFDEDLAGSDFLTSSNHVGAMIVARRRGSVGNAVRAVTGLPYNLCDSFLSHIRLTDDPTSPHRMKASSFSPEGSWLTPVQFDEMLEESLLPPPPILAGFARSLASTAHRADPFVPLLPGQRSQR